MTDSLSRWSHADFLSRSKKLYDEGDKTQILKCLHSCLQCHEPIPPWLEQAFKDAYAAKGEYKIKSWDEVFGQPLKKYERSAKRRRDFDIMLELFKRVEERHKAGEPIDKQLFSSVGREFGVGGTVASELYYDVKTAKESMPVVTPKEIRKLIREATKALKSENAQKLRKTIREATKALKALKSEKTRKLPGKLKNIREY